MDQMSFSNNGGLIDDAKMQREPNWDKDINWFDLPDDDEVHTYRLVAAPYYYAQHWIQTFKKDGVGGKPFPAICQNFDHKTNTYAENGCEICKFLDGVNSAIKETKTEWKNLPAHIQKMSRRLTMATNAIVREIQIAGAPANNTQGWSYIRPVRFPQGFAKTMKEKQDKLNKRDGVVYALNDIKEGRDLLISYNSQSDNKNNIYSLDLGGVAPLTAEELTQAPALTNFHAHMKYPKQDGLADALKRFKYYDWLNEHRNSATMTSVPKTQAAPAAAAPAQTGRQGGDGGAFAQPTTPEPPFEEDPAPKAAPQPEPVQAAAPAAPVQPAAPAPVQAAPAPVEQPAQPVQAAAPAAVPPSNPPPAVQQQVQQNMAGQNNIEGRLQSFSTQHGTALVVKGLTYQKNLRNYRADLAVPDCWALYNVNGRGERKDVCKACPVRLDCMMIS